MFEIVVSSSLLGFFLSGFKSELKSFCGKVGLNGFVMLQHWEVMNLFLCGLVHQLFLFD